MHPVPHPSSLFAKDGGTRARANRSPQSPRQQATVGNLELREISVEMKA
jgi:hypothetical protein